MAQPWRDPTRAVSSSASFPAPSVLLTPLPDILSASQGSVTFMRSKLQLCLGSRAFRKSRTGATLNTRGTWCPHRGPCYPGGACSPLHTGRGRISVSATETWVLCKSHPLATCPVQVHASSTPTVVQSPPQCLEPALQVPPPSSGLSSAHPVLQDRPTGSRKSLHPRGWPGSQGANPD